MGLPGRERHIPLRHAILVILAVLFPLVSSAAPKGAAADAVRETYPSPPDCHDVPPTTDTKPEIAEPMLDARAVLHASVALIASPSPEQRLTGYKLLTGLFWENWGLTDRWLDRYLPEVQCGELWSHARRHLVEDALLAPEPLVRKNRAAARKSMVLLGVPEAKDAALAALKEAKTSDERVALVYLRLLSLVGQRPWKEPSTKLDRAGLVDVDFVDQTSIATLSQTIPSDDPAHRAIAYYRRLLDTYGLLYVEGDSKVVEARDAREGSFFRRPLGGF